MAARHRRVLFSAVLENSQGEKKATAVAQYCHKEKVSSETIFNRLLVRNTCLNYEKLNIIPVVVVFPEIKVCGIWFGQHMMMYDDVQFKEPFSMLLTISNTTVKGTSL